MYLFIQVGSQETSVSGSQNSEPGASESDSTRAAQPTSQSIPTVSLSQAQRQMSLFFALCTKVCICFFVCLHWKPKGSQLEYAFILAGSVCDDSGFFFFFAETWPSATCI